MENFNGSCHITPMIQLSVLSPVASGSVAQAWRE